MVEFTDKQITDLMDPVETGWDLFDEGGTWGIERDDEIARYADDHEAYLAVVRAAATGLPGALVALFLDGRSTNFRTVPAVFLGKREA